MIGVKYKAFPGVKFARKCGESMGAMLEAELLPRAREDFAESYAWYYAQSERAAARFEIFINDATEKLRRKPDLGVRLDDKHRSYRIKKSFPFYLVYRTEPTKILIIAVAHNGREPGYWRGRDR
jgi:plasmid stabilization system protein ParE